MNRVQSRIETKIADRMVKIVVIARTRIFNVLQTL